MDVAITRMSSKGQVVIPSEMREDIEEGEKMILIKYENKIIMKKASDMDKNLKEDMEFARRTEEALKSYDRGEFKSMDSKDFLKLIEKW